MVAGVNPVKLIVYVPVPVPEVALNVDDNELVPYTTPRDVTLAPPSDVMVPPLVAVEDVIDIADAVAEIVGIFKVVKLVCAP